MAKDHGPSIKNDKQYEGLRKKGGEKSGKGSGGSKSQKRAAGREGGKKSSGKSS